MKLFKHGVILSTGLYQVYGIGRLYKKGHSFLEFSQVYYTAKIKQ